MLTPRVAVALAVLVCSVHGKNPIQELQNTMTSLIKQLMMQQFAREEQVRADGHSGIKAIRLRGEGTRPYHATSHSDDFTEDGIHDHSDFEYTADMGETQAVLNGIEFRTRHNDFLHVMKSTTCNRFGYTERILYPDVPLTVLAQPTLEDEIQELREYFVAWRDQNETHRDYKPYFKASLCYMEGAWTFADQDTIQEAFSSERHWYEAYSWSDMTQKARFSAYSGTKENLENYAFMPRSILGVDDDGAPIFGQWNYRILCHPLEDDLPLNRFRGVDDLKARMTLGLTYDEYLQNRNARFQINPVDRDSWCDEATKHGFLDKLMEQIPGYDNYGAYIEDDSFNNIKKDFDAAAGDTTVKNAANYHRWFQNENLGAMGARVRHRGYSDENLWMAMNTQPNIVPTQVTVCSDPDDEDTCESWEQRWSYAIPMEVFYATPLHNYNPYDIEHKGFEHTPAGYTVYAGPDGPKSRDGSNDVNFAWNGTNSAKFYHTPIDVFIGGETGEDPADTPDDFTYVLDSTGTPRQVRSSGIRAFLPAIPGVGELRTRWPINPVYGEGSPVWKELSALSDIIMQPSRYDFMIRDDADPVCGPPGTLRLRSGASNAAHGSHTHMVILSSTEQQLLNQGASVMATSEEAHSHTHTFVIEQSHDTLNGFIEEVFVYTQCSGAPVCFDGHSPEFDIVS